MPFGYLSRRFIFFLSISVLFSLSPASPIWFSFNEHLSRRHKKKKKEKKKKKRENSKEDRSVAVSHV